MVTNNRYGEQLKRLGCENIEESKEHLLEIFESAKVDQEPNHPLNKINPTQNLILLGATLAIFSCNAQPKAEKHDLENASYVDVSVVCRENNGIVQDYRLTGEEFAEFLENIEEIRETHEISCEENQRLVGELIFQEPDGYKVISYSSGIGPSIEPLE